MKHDDYNKSIDLFLKEVSKTEKDFVDFLNKEDLGKLIVKIAYILCYDNFKFGEKPCHSEAPGRRIFCEIFRLCSG